MVEQVFSGQRRDAVAVAGEVSGGERAELTVRRVTRGCDGSSQEVLVVGRQQRCGDEDEGLGGGEGVVGEGRCRCGVTADQAPDQVVDVCGGHSRSVAGGAVPPLTPG